ncbi:MAG: sugar phosphate isomerase/epimerase [Lentisphaeria bacterium]|nr:sugar phosphate isomerase/epimerase [Lentisphaeria bacterium]
MSAPAPISYLFDFLSYPENLRKCRLNEFAANGAKHLVLSSPLLKHLIAHPEQAKKFAGELTESGLSFGDAHAPYGMHWDLICVFEEERPALFIRQKMALIMAAELGCKTVTMHTGADNLFPEIPTEKHLSRACDMLEKLLPEAEKLNIVIAVENGWSKLTSLDTLLYLRKKFPTPSFGFCYDSGHANIMDSGRLYTEGEAYLRWNAVGVAVPPWEDAAVRLERMLPDVVNCHLHDNYGNKDQHDLPGKGNVKWDKIVPLLQKAPRLQAVQCEVNLERNALPVKAVTETFDKLFQ